LFVCCTIGANEYIVKFQMRSIWDGACTSYCTSTHKSDRGCSWGTSREFFRGSLSRFS
jgi:hypothetical protein